MSLTVKSSHLGQDVQALSIGREGTNFSLNIDATATSYTPKAPVVGLTSDVGYHLNIGGTAATTDFFVPGNVMWFVICENLDISCFTATGGQGTLYISEAV